jgi:four helix bundle protein
MGTRKGADIQERAFEFAVRVVELVDVLVTRGMSTRVLATQVLRSSTSIGANLEEADAGQSRADFISKCSIALKEARESHYWLRLLTRTRKITSHDRAEQLVAECNEIVAVLTTIVRKSRARA